MITSSGALADIFPHALRQAYHSGGTVVRGDFAGLHVLPATAGLATARFLSCV